MAGGMRANELDLVACSLCEIVCEGRSACETQRLDCPRCGSALRVRKRHAHARSAAYLIAALVLYIPANVYGVVTGKLRYSAI